MMQPPDLGVSVKLANEALDVATRPIDWIHMPVPMSRNDEDYFRPLRGLNDNTRLFLGLVHHTDGVEGTVKRIQSAKKFKKDFGIATECGFGRRPADQIPELLEIHRKSLNAI